MEAYKNMDAEYSVLGAALQSEKALKLVVEMEPDEFTEESNRIVLAAMKELVKTGTPVDLVTMYTELQKGNRNDIIGPTYLMKLIEFTPTTANVSSYIKIVRECTGRRRLRAIG